MSAATAKQHQPTELTYHGTRDGVAVFSSASKSRPGERNFTYLDLGTMQVACECQAKQGTCWHCDLVLTRWAMVQVAGFVAGLSDAALVEVGTAAGAAIAAQTHTATDIAVYHQSKVEWCKRARAAREAAALLAAFPPEKIRAPRPCPDCGEPTYRRYLCDGCQADLDAYRAEVAAKEAAGSAVAA